MPAWRCATRAWSAICGSCAMLIDSKSRLACQTSVGAEFAEHGRIVVDPMRNQPILKDLVVDQKPFWREGRMDHPAPDHRPSLPVAADTPTMMSPEQVERFEETRRCIACGACCISPARPSRPTRPSPGRWRSPSCTGSPSTRAMRPTASGCSASSPGLWTCLRCHLCTSSCPKDVRPSERIGDLKEMAIRVQGGTEAGSRHAVGFKDNIADRGLLNEMKLVRQTDGVLGMVGQLPQGLRMTRKKPGDPARAAPHRGPRGGPADLRAARG